MSALLENEPDQSQFKRNGETPWNWAQEALTQAPYPPVADDPTDLEKWMRKYREWFAGPREGARLKLWKVEDLAAYVGVDTGWVLDKARETGIGDKTLLNLYRLLCRFFSVAVAYGEMAKLP